MKIAVSVDDRNQIAPHLGKCKIFNVYRKTGDQVELLEIIWTNGDHRDHIIEEICDCDVVVSRQIGEGMIKNLRRRKIRPYVELDTLDPVEAVKKIY